MFTPSRFRPLPLLAVLGLLPSLAAAQSSAEPAVLSDIVVTASRMPQAREDVLGDVTVIDSETLRQAGNLSLAEVLAQQPGISFNSNGGPQTVTGISLRGAASAHTLVLLDGVPINSATDGMAMVQALPVANIERIEVLRGSASSLYGANAIGGVINLITRPNTDEALSARASVGYGSRGTAKASAAVSGKQDAWTYHVGGGYERSSGFDATTPDGFSPHPDKDGYRNYSVNGGLGYTWAPGQQLDLQFLKGRSNGQIDYAFMAAPQADDRLITNQDTVSLSSRNQINAVWHSTLRYAYTHTATTTRGHDSFSNQYADLYYATYQNQFAWENRLQLDESQSLLLAYEHQAQRVHGDAEVWDPVNMVSIPANYDVTRRHNNAVMGVYTGSFGRHHLQASLRNDHDSQFGGHATWGLSYGFDLSTTLRARVAANTGYLAPSFNYLYYPGNSNPNLKPEKSRNLEAALEYQSRTLALSATVYQNKVRDLISAVWPNPPQNLDRATLRGLTLSGRYQFAPRSRVWASLDLLHARDDLSGARLPRRAPHTLRLGIEHRVRQWTLGSDYMLMGQRYDDVPNATRLGSYGLWNLSVVYALKPNLDLAFRWNNVLDKRYATTYGFNMPRSHAFVELSWRL